MAQNGGQSSLARDAPLPQLFEVRVDSHIDIGAWSAIQVRNSCIQQRISRRYAASSQPLAVEFEHETGLQNEHDVESGETAAVRRQPGISARRFRRVSRSRRRSRRETGSETAVYQGTATVTTLVMLPSPPRGPGHRDTFLRTEIALGVTTTTCKRQ